MSDWLSQIRRETEQFGSDRLRIIDTFAHAVGASLLYSYGLIEQGVAAAERAKSNLTALERSGVDGPELDLIRAEARLAMATGLYEMGRLAEAESEFRAALALAREVPAASEADPGGALRVVALSRLGLGNILLERYERAEARQAYTDVLDWLDARRAEAASEDASLEHWRVLALRGVAASEPRYQDARPYYAEASALLEQLRDASPDNLLWLTYTAELAYREAFSMMNDASPSEVQSKVRQALEYAETLHELDARNLRWRHDLAQAHRTRGMLYERTEETGRARESYARLRELATDGRAQQPSWKRIRQLHAVSNYYCVGFDPERSAANGDPCAGPATDGTSSATLESYREMARLLEELTRDAPQAVSLRRDAAIAHSNVGDELMGMGGDLAHATREAEEAHSRAIELMESLDPRLQADPYFAGVTAYAYDRLGNLLEDTGRPMEAVAHRRAALSLRESIVESVPTPQNFDGLGITQYNLAAAHASAGDTAEAVEQYLRVLAIYDRGLETMPDDPVLLYEKADMAYSVAYRVSRFGRYALATDVLEEAADAGLAAFAADPLSYDIVERLSSIDSEAESIQSRLLESAGSDSSSVEGTVGDPDTLVPRLQQIRADVEPGRVLNPDLNDGITAGTVGTSGFHWDHPPLVGGPWRTLEPAEVKAEVQRLEASDRTRALAPRVLRIRTIPLSFYPGADLYEAEARSPGMAGTGILSYVRLGEETLVLDGASSPIHRFNSTALELQSPAQALEYLDFFMTALTGEEGTFRLVSSPGELSFTEAADEATRTQARRLVTPPRIRERPNGAWDARGTVQYGQALFQAMLRISPDGSVEMNDDQAATAGLPLMSERYDADDLRILVAPEADYQDLVRTTREHFDAGRWTEAAAGQAEVVDLMFDRLEEGEERDEQLAGALVSLAFFSLFASDFATALTASESAHVFDDGSLEVLIDTNRAHALLLLDRVDDAEVVYRKHRGRQVSPTSDLTWEEAIADDLAALAAAGVTHPAVERILAMLERP